MLVSLVQITGKVVDVLFEIYWIDGGIANQTGFDFGGLTQSVNDKTQRLRLEEV